MYFAFTFWFSIVWTDRSHFKQLWVQKFIYKLDAHSLKFKIFLVYAGLARHMELYYVYIKSLNRHQEWIHHIRTKTWCHTNICLESVFLVHPNDVVTCATYIIIANSKDLIQDSCSSVRLSLSTFLHGAIVLRVRSKCCQYLLSDAAHFVSSTNKYHDVVNISEYVTIRGYQFRNQADTTFTYSHNAVRLCHVTLPD